MQKILRNSLIIGIIIALLTPISLVIADDTEPPVITNIQYTPHAGVRTDPGFSMVQSCTVTDNVSVADVRINITGPVGFTPINDSMVLTGISDYSYSVNTSNVSVEGTYAFYIWAIDPSGNSMRSLTYYMLIFDAYQSYIHVDVNNTGGPWNGSAAYPLQYIDDALAVIAPNGTIFIHAGVYSNTSMELTKDMTILGENQGTTILDGGGLNTSAVVDINGSFLITISTLTVQNAKIGMQAQDGVNSTVSHCTFTSCSDAGISLSDYQYLLVTDCTFQNNNRGIQLTNCSHNQFYHNNFLNNAVHVSTYDNSSSNSWDNGTTGNYWDDYLLQNPTAQIIPATGTWDTPYLVNASGNNTDNHPWVYPNGYIDTIPPTVTVVYPNGGEVLVGDIMIQWVASDDLTANLNGTILIEYSPDNGNNWTVIASNQNNTGFYLWNTTFAPDGESFLIRVSATDEFLNTGSDTSDGVFSIDNIDTVPPYVLVIYPNGGEVVYGETLIQWFASDDKTLDLNGTILLEYSADNGSNWTTIASMQNNDGIFPWNTTTLPDGNAYLIRVSATDEAMNIGSDTSNATFTINNHLNFPPIIHQISGPWAGGRGIKFNFTVNATDPEGDLVYYKWDWNDGNVTAWLGPYASGEPMTISYAWENNANYSVQVKARDIGGGESNWSVVHLIRIAPQVNFSNVNIGFIYFKLFSFQKSFIYSDFLRRLGTCFILTSHEMSLEAYTTDVVKSVSFRAENQLEVITVDYLDDNGSNGFSCTLNVSRGVYILNVTAYDANGTLVDTYGIPTVFFIRIGRYAFGPQTQLQHLQRMLSNVRLRLRH